MKTTLVGVLQTLRRVVAGTRHTLANEVVETRWQEKAGDLGGEIFSYPLHFLKVFVSAFLRRGHPSERDYPNGREEFSERGRKAYNSGSGSNFPSKYGRQRTRHGSSDNLPEWASDEAGPGDRGGSFDASGKFQVK